MKLSRSVLIVALAAGLLAGCRGGPTATVEVPTPESVGFGAPELTVAQPPVSFRESELGEPRELTASETMTVTPGANILVRDGGRAALAWPELLTADMMSGADVLLSQSDPTSRQIMIDQATGTTRYDLQPSEPAAQLTVKSAWADMQMGGEGGSAVVSYIPGPDPSVWFVVLGGTAQLKRGAEAMIALGDGQAVGLTESGPIPEPQSIDATAVDAWLEQVAAGAAKASVASVALRCRVESVATDFLAQPDPDAAPAGDQLTQGTSVEVLGRNEAATWLRVRPLATAADGWVVVGALACNGPVDGAAVSAAAEPTATKVVRPVVTIVRPVAPSTSTPTMTPTAVSAVKIYFGTTDDSIAQDTCSKLVWEVQGIKEVYVNGKGVTGKGEMEVCPDETTTYTMKVVHTDGTVEERSVEIEVRKPEATTPVPSQTPEPPTSQPAPTATATP